MYINKSANQVFSDLNQYDLYNHTLKFTVE
jgi:hypothetical protein